jgi:pimeloyl-ACP methyl ester carboxylesterase
MEHAIVHESGPKHGPAFVFLHGSPGSLEDWAQVIAKRPSGARTLVVELPDHGSAPESELGVLELEQVALDFVRSLESPEVHLVGVSMGAWLSARIAHRVPEKITRVVLLAGFDRLGEDGAAMRRGLQAQMRAGEIPASAAPGICEPLFFGTAQVSDADRARLRASWERITLTQWDRHLSRAIGCAAPEAQVEPFTVPGVALHGRGDAAVPFALGEALVRLAANVRLEPIDTDAHLLPVTHSELVAAAVFG